MAEQDAFLYQYSNIGIDPASIAQTGAGTQYQYSNIGIDPASIAQTGAGTQYQYENVDGTQSINAELPPTFN